MKYEIWKLPPSSPNKFMRYNWVIRPVRIRDYVKVYEKYDYDNTSVDDQYLENIFYVYNQEIPDDYYSEPMCVSDLICVVDKENKRYWWYVDGVGFKELDGEKI